MTQTLSKSAPFVVEGRPNCWACRHFAVSWDPKLPYSCKLLGFKSKFAPCLEVIKIDGRPCQGYSEKVLQVS